MSIRSKVWRELQKKPRRMKELKAKLGNDKKVQRIVTELLARGRIAEKDGAYYIAGSEKAENALVCRMVKLGPTFGFAQPIEKDSRDIFIPGRALAGAMVGDEVLVSLFDRPRLQGSLEGEVLAVSKPRQRFVGTVEEVCGKLFLVPDDCRSVYLQIKKSATGGVCDGDKAAVEILERGPDHGDHRAGVTMRFGNANEARQCVKALVYAAGMTRRFPDRVKLEAHCFKEPTPAELEERLNLRSWPIFTIDSAETKDIDDAISLSRTETGYELGVHIADVSHYVQPGSELDEEAFNRGASVYYGNNVIPMFPKYLSNNLCSLNEKEDRLTFSCLMQLDEAGRVQSFRFVKSAIRSRVKGVYSEINALLNGSDDAKLQEKYAEVSQQLPLMKELYEKRVALRRECGYIQLESGDAVFIMDEKDHCVDVQCRERGISECIIEEFMLLANECAAKLAREQELPLVYRVHEEPEAERVERLHRLLNSCGVPAKFAKTIPNQKELAALLESVQDMPCKGVVNQGVLRTMSKARYEEKPLGHYGLALADYAHFTSPIRRYPDLAVHRILSDWCAGATAEELQLRYGAFAAEAARQASTRETAILQVERNAEDCYKAEYMHEHLGEEYPGVISGVAKQGLYVALPNMVEGLVRTDTICKGEPELTDGLCLIDSLTGARWQLGQQVKIRVLAADVAQRRIDFELLD